MLSSPFYIKIKNDKCQFIHYFGLSFAYLTKKSEICDAFKRNFTNTFK